MLFFTDVAFAQRTKSSMSSGEQRNAEKGLKDNRYFFYFIDSSISNFGTADEKKQYKEAIQRDIIAQQLYMKFLFHESFQEIRKAQKILIELYRTVLKRDIEATRQLLNEFAKDAIWEKKYKSKHYLRLGYRDLAVAKIYLRMADHYKDLLYSYRLYKYVRAIKKAKHGKRYAFYAQLEVMNKETKEIKYGHLSFEALEKLISAIPGNEAEYFSLLHYDNYYRTKNGKSFYDTTWEKPDLFEIDDYKKYLEMR